jgi:hypothetical protein
MLLDHSALDEDAVILYDSYSSDLLKGVRFSHRNLKAQIVALQLQFEFNSPVILQQNGIQVGTSLLQMLVSLTTGRMWIMTPHGNNPTEISGLILEEGVDTAFASHDEYSLWLEYGSQTLQQCERWHKAFCTDSLMIQDLSHKFSDIGTGELQVISLYGPIEASMACCAALVDYRNWLFHYEDHYLSVGWKLRNYNVFVADRVGRPLPPG